MRMQNSPIKSGTNLTILEDNILFALREPSAQRMYCRLKDHMSAERAEDHAFRWKGVAESLRVTLPMAGRQFPVSIEDDVIDDLFDYMAERFFHQAKSGLSPR